MLALNFVLFYLCFVAFPQIISSARVNTTSSDGKVFISGDHNEVIVSADRESKITLALIMKKVESLDKKDKEFSGKLQALVKIRGNLDVLSQTFQNLSQTVDEKMEALDKRILTIEKNRGNLKVMNRTIETLSKIAESQDNNIKRLNKSNAELLVQLQAISQRVSALEMRDNHYALLFPRKGTSDYVIITRGMPSLKAVTVCLWMKTAGIRNEGTTLSYAVQGSDNELLLIDNRNVLFWVGSKQSGKTSLSASDDKWHHICATWENTAGSWKLYKDGKVAAAGKGLSKGHVVRGNGALVLGQEQDATAGSFDANQCFIGEMTGVNIWNHVIKEQEIIRMSKSCLSGVGNVFQWRDFKPHVKGSVKIIKPSC